LFSMSFTFGKRCFIISQLSSCRIVINDDYFVMCSNAHKTDSSKK
jgi:hypothetical protein